MAHAKLTALAAAIGVTFCASGALAAGKCNIVGTFTDSLGSHGQFTTEKKGTVTNTSICPKTYNLTVTKLTNKIIDVTGKVAGGTCGALTGNFTFQNGGCTTAKGTVTIAGLGSLPDTITKTGAAVATRPADNSAFFRGIH